MDEIAEYYQIIISAFRKLAPVYDLIAAPASGVRRQVADLLPASSKLKILDVATGTGAQAFAFASRGHEVIGIDLSEAMLNVARKHNANSQVTFQAGDATDLPFSNDQFEVCSISFALHDMPRPIREKVLKQMVRVVKPKGMILIVDYALPQNRIGRFLIQRLISLYEGEYYQQFIQSDLESLLGQTGIGIYEQKIVLMGAARILIGMPTMTMASAPPALFGELIDTQAQGNL